MPSSPEPAAWPSDVKTLAIDIGGSGFKAAVLSVDGAMTTSRVRIETPYPCPPEVFIDTVTHLVHDLGSWDRVSVGFPGLVRQGCVRNIPTLSRRAYDGESDPELEALWENFNLESALTAAFNVPVKVANDADVQGCAVVEGNGFEFVMTLGTGVGTALFLNGRLAPHLEAGHAPFRKGDTFEEQLGNVARVDVGNDRWRRRLLKAIDAYQSFLFFDTIYIGGGNAKHVDPSTLPPNARIIDNTAGITGGVRLWELDS